ncbi:MAG: S-adenosylmethionine:tRNA ribosyltransferase-isomerase [Nitrospinaceae bacterium]|nr:MAG: S-adenosylmethionine:tRNA ribosyltransferase-isomerase [Nitrospinaceae bacterium]
MKLSDFDFDLPQELIAQKPAEVRDQSRLMVVNRLTSTISHDTFSNFSNYLTHHPLLVFNDTRVIPAKLPGFKKDTEKPVEVLLIREQEPDLWEALIKGLGKMKPGTQLILCDKSLTATLIERKDGRGLLKLDYQGDLRPLLERAARMPLPPYIRRKTHDNEDLVAMDRERYQTVYAASEGAIAAPTAGLHFTPHLLDKIRAEKADLAFLTLHVGVGTFLPLRTEDVHEHRMEKERFHLSQDAGNQIYQAKKKGQKVLAVGTTTTRVLESLLFDAPIQGDISGETDKFIFPGVDFRTVDQLLTNFHLPKSTLFLLACAFSGTELMRRAYQEAIEQKYRFFSYGDAMLIL